MTSDRSVWIESRRTKRGTLRYRLCYYNVSGDQVKRTLKGKVDRRLAESERYRLEDALNQPGARRPPTTWAESVAEHLALAAGRKRLQPATMEEMKRALDAFGVHIGPDTVLDEITPDDIEEYLGRRITEGASPATANKDLRAIKIILSSAVRRRRISESPADKVDPQREERQEIRVLREDEIEALITACRNDVRWRTFVILALTTGMRRGELVHLEWTDVEPGTGLIHVRNKPEHRVKSAVERNVALTPRGDAALQEHRADCEARGVLSRWIFTAPSGAPWLNNLNRSFAGIVRRAQIRTCTIHDLRRTFVSQLAMSGVSALVVQHAAGHASLSTTQKFYTGVEDRAIVAAAQKLPYAALPAANKKETA